MAVLSSLAAVGIWPWVSLNSTSIVVFSPRKPCSLISLTASRKPSSADRPANAAGPVSGLMLTNLIVSGRLPPSEPPPPPLVPPPLSPPHADTDSNTPAAAAATPALREREILIPTSPDI